MLSEVGDYDSPSNPKETKKLVIPCYSNMLSVVKHNQNQYTDLKAGDKVLLHNVRDHDKHSGHLRPGIDIEKILSGGKIFKIIDTRKNSYFKDTIVGFLVPEFDDVYNYKNIIVVPLVSEFVKKIS